MKHTLLIDNWTLQNAGELICEGPKQDPTRELIFADDMRSYRSRIRLADASRIEALCQLLHTIVFTDEIRVDADYVDCWLKYSPLLAIKRAKLLKLEQFRNHEDKWLAIRDEVAVEICPDEALRKENWQDENVSDSKPSRAKDRFFAQMLWGGAGMLARANYFDLTYATHPSRERFLERTKFMSATSSSNTFFRTFVNQQRVRLFERLDVLGYFGALQLPPVAVEIIMEASCIKDLLPVALQKRSDYRKLRTWLGEFQGALNSGNTKKQITKKRLLEDVARQLDDSKHQSALGETSVSVGFSWPSLSLSPNAIWRNIRNRFGVRAQLNRIVLAPKGEAAVKKMVHFLDAKGTNFGLRLEKEMLNRFK